MRRAAPGEARVPGAPAAGVRPSLPPNEQITRDREHSPTMRLVKRTLVYVFLTSALPLLALERQPNAAVRAGREHLPARFLAFAGTENACRSSALLDGNGSRGVDVRTGAKRRPATRPRRSNTTRKMSGNRSHV